MAFAKATSSAGMENGHDNVSWNAGTRSSTNSFQDDPHRKVLPLLGNSQAVKNLVAQLAEHRQPIGKVGGHEFESRLGSFEVE